MMGRESSSPDVFTERLGSGRSIGRKIKRQMLAAESNQTADAPLQGACTLGVSSILGTVVVSKVGLLGSTVVTANALSTRKSRCCGEGASQGFSGQAVQ